MVGFGSRHRSSQSVGRLKLGSAVLMFLAMLAGVFGPATAGAQEGPLAGLDPHATLYPECDVLGVAVPPYLVVGNLSDDPVEVTAGALTFTVGSFDVEFRDVPAELTPEDVLIDGVAGLVEAGSCADFDIAVAEDQLRSFFTATFTSGCPADIPPGKARLEVGLSAAGKANLEALGALDFEGEEFDAERDEDEYGDEGLGRFPLPFEVDGDLVLVTFPAGLDLGLDAAATVPEVKIFEAVLPVELLEGDCAGAPAKPSAPSPGGAVAAPLTPKFTG